MVALGQIYLVGLGLNKDIRLAEYWFKQAADRGDLQALYELGKLYFYSHNDYERAQPYIMAAVNTSKETNAPIGNVPPQDINATLQALATHANAGAGAYDAAHFTPKTFDDKLNDLRHYFYWLDLPSKQVFIGNLRNNPTDEVKNYPKYRKFLNECIKEYNAQVKHHNSEVRLQDLRAYFDSLGLSTKQEFIQKLQENPPEIKGQPKYKRFTNEVIADYNAEVRRANLHILDAELEKMRRVQYVAAQQASRLQRAQGQSRGQNQAPGQNQSQKADGDALKTQLDTHVAQLHYYGASCNNCRHLDMIHKCNVGIVLSRWKAEGYNVCEKWERR